jgi:hypothetical protein
MYPLTKPYMHARVFASESIGSSLFIVQSGSLRVTVENDGACRQLAVFQKGACAFSLSLCVHVCVREME